MNETILASVQSIDTETLTGIVRQDQRDPEFSLLDWSVERLSSKGVMNSEGLWQYFGTGMNSAGDLCQWSVVLKLFVDVKLPEDPRDKWAEIRDAQVHESGLLDTLPPGLVTPRCYGVWMRGETWWIWMEHIEEFGPERWSVPEFAAAARALGRFNGAYLAGQPIPDYPWLCREQCRYWLAMADQWVNWESPYVQRYITPHFRARYDRLTGERERFYAAVNRLPQVFSHFDAHRRNIKFRRGPDGQRQLVAFDWAMAGTGAVGSELYTLGPGSVFLFELSMDELPAVEQATLAEYEAGLLDAGAQVEYDQVRLGYQLLSGLWWGGALASLIGAWTHESMAEAARTVLAQPPDVIASTYAALGEYCFDLLDQARPVLDRLGW